MRALKPRFKVQVHFGVELKIKMARCLPWAAAPNPMQCKDAVLQKRVPALSGHPWPGALA